MELVEFLAGTGHDVEIRDTRDPVVAAAAGGYGIRRLPAVVIDGQLADWFATRGLDEESLTRAISGASPMNEVLRTGAPSDTRRRSPILAAILDRRANPRISRGADERVSFPVEAAVVLIVSLALWAVICYAVTALVSSWR